MVQDIKGKCSGEDADIDTVFKELIKAIKDKFTPKKLMDDYLGIKDLLKKLKLETFIDWIKDITDIWKDFSLEKLGKCFNLGGALIEVAKIVFKKIREWMQKLAFSKIEKYFDVNLLMKKLKVDTIEKYFDVKKLVEMIRKPIQKIGLGKLMEYVDWVGLLTYLGIQKLLDKLKPTSLVNNYLELQKYVDKLKPSNIIDKYLDIEGILNELAAQADSMSVEDVIKSMFQKIGQKFDFDKFVQYLDFNSLWDKISWSKFIDYLGVKTMFNHVTFSGCIKYIKVDKILEDLCKAVVGACTNSVLGSALGGVGCKAVGSIGGGLVSSIFG
jgi:hypothetical protein